MMVATPVDQAEEVNAVAIANAEQAAAWNGEEGDRWTDHEERYDASAHRHGLRMLDAARISAADRVLDVGCGCGGSTREAARRASSGMALGVDLSKRMLERARERSRAERLANVRFEQADAQVYPFEAGAFDLAISRFGVMFFDDPVAAFRNIARALRPGGRLAVLAWQELRKNAWVSAIRDALAAGRALPEPSAGAPGPFSLADADRVRQILAEAELAQVALEAVDEPMDLGRDAEDACGFVRTLGITTGMLAELDDATAAKALAAVRATLAAHDTGQGVLFGSSAWLITATRA
jgi:SAM-dependent methyltransferase